jgi:hypothetical protein
MRVLARYSGGRRGLLSLTTDSRSA